MADEPLLPVFRVHGSHREVGHQIGEVCATEVRAAVDFTDAHPRDGRTLDEQLALAEEYRDVTRRSLPYLIEELDAVAEAAGVDPLHVFARSIEEIWAADESDARSAMGVERGRCSDLVAGPPATATGGVLIAHTNDLDASVEPHLAAIDWNVDGQPRMFTVGVGPWISVGWNSAGLALSGNELAPNDNRLGVPRLLLVREELRHITVASATEATLRPDRASAYNTIFADRSGTVVNIEGSATDAATMTLDAAGTLVHTNHYVCQRMLGYEDDPPYAARSNVRFERGAELLSEAARTPGSVTQERLIEMLSDHENAPDSLCRHLVAGNSTKTVFWSVTDMSDELITFGKGNPCDSVPQTFRFETG